jgi:hypothetical protein
MKTLISPSGEFLRFQGFLRVRGSVDLGALECSLERDIARLGQTEHVDSLHDQEVMASIAQRLLLWYCIGWAVEDAKDRHWSPFSRSVHPAIERMAEHREQLQVFGRELGFSTCDRLALQSPEGMGDRTRHALVVLVWDIRVPKGEIFTTSPLFKGDWNLERGRYYEPKATHVTAPVWGVDNFTKALEDSPRLHFSVNRLMANAGLGTSKVHGRKFYY